MLQLLLLAEQNAVCCHHGMGSGHSTGVSIQRGVGSAHSMGGGHSPVGMHCIPRVGKVVPEQFRSDPGRDMNPCNAFRNTAICGSVYHF